MPGGLVQTFADFSCIKSNSLNSLDILLFLLAEENLLMTFSSVASIALAVQRAPAYLYTSLCRQ